MPDYPTRAPVYLGDGVYASIERGMIQLTTGHHLPHYADATIYLEPEVFEALIQYMKPVQPMKGPTDAE